MTRSALLLGILFGGLAWPMLALSETGSAPAIPDFSGGWDRIGDLLETFEATPGRAGAGPLLVDPLHPHVNESRDLTWAPALDNPILKPETLARLRPIVDAEIRGIPHIKEEGHCQPSGVPGLLNVRGGSIELLQTPTQVTIIHPVDQQGR